MIKTVQEFLIEDGYQDYQNAIALSVRSAAEAWVLLQLSDEFWDDNLLWLDFN